jgi:hypothetical protein
MLEYLDSQHLNLLNKMKKQEIEQIIEDTL